MGSCSSSANATPQPLPKQDGEVKQSSHSPVSARPALRECPVCLDEVTPRHWRAIPCDSHCGACVTCVHEHMRVTLQGMPGAEGNAWPFTCPVCEADIGEAETLQCVSPGHRSDVHRFSIRSAVQCDSSRTLRVCPHGGCSGVFFTTDEAGSGSQQRSNGCITPCPACSKGVCLACSSAEAACSCDGTMVKRLDAAGIELRCCPGCGAPAVKTSGCERMKCLHCGCNWDWERGQKASSASTLYTGSARTRWEWARMGIMVLVAAILLLEARDPSFDLLCRASMLVAAMYVAAEGLLSRGTSLMGTHLLAVLVGLGFGIVLHSAAGTLAGTITSLASACVPAFLARLLLWLCPSFVAAAAWFVWQWTTWMLASALAWVVLGSAFVLVLADWGPTLTKMCRSHACVCARPRRRSCLCCCRARVKAA